MSHSHSFWFFLTWACVIWYSTTTLYVAVQGAIDIKQMLRRLREGQSKRESKREP
jgi:hypothetical protein